ncbi:MAG: FecR domain-containing protein [Bacteroidales bacterium]|nr:FecR domain-containing protein [Bacteroidales bacterium]
MDEGKIFDYLNNECDADEKLKIEEWIAANQSHFHAIETLWEESGYDASRDNLDFEAAWKRINPNSRSQTYPKKTKPVVFVRNLLKIAAVIVFILGIGYIIANKYNRSSKNIVWLEKANLTNGFIKIDLADGSQLWLNANSRIKYPEEFDTRSRTVILSGEAFFEVKHDDEWPFVVNTGNTTTKVLGTSFNINALDSTEIQVVVVTGKVSFSGKSNKIILTAGDKGIYIATDEELTKEVNSDPNFLAWKTGDFVFNQTSLEEVCKALNKHFHQSIHIKDEALKHESLTARFSSKSLTEILDIISLTLPVSVNCADSCISLYRNQGQYEN